MTALFGSRQRADEFAARVDGLVEAPADAPEASSVGSETLGQQDLMLALVTQLRRQTELASASAPRPEFAASLRDALVAEAATALPVQAAAPARRPLRPARPKRLAAAATVAVLVSGSAGMAAAAETSLPGEALYPVKRGMETVDVRLSRTAAGRGHDLLSQASTRLSEVKGLLALDSATAATYVPPTLATFTWQAEEGAEQLLIAYSETKDASTIAEVRSFAADSAQTLTSIVASTPATASVQAELHAAASSVGQVDEAATEACEQCSDLDAVDVEAVLLASAAADGVTDGVTGASIITDGGVLDTLVGDAASADPLAPLTVDPAEADQSTSLGEALGGGAVAPPADASAPPPDASAPPADADAPPPNVPPSGGPEGEGDGGAPVETPPQEPSGQPSDEPTAPDPEQPTETPTETPTEAPSEAPSESSTDNPSPEVPAESSEPDRTTGPTAPADVSTLPADTDAGSTGDGGAAIVEDPARAVPVRELARGGGRTEHGRPTSPGRSGG